MYHPSNVKQVIKWQEGEIHSSRTATEIRFQCHTVIPHGHFVQTEHLIKCWRKFGTGLCTYVTRKYTVLYYCIGFVPCVLFFFWYILCIFHAM